MTSPGQVAKLKRNNYVVNRIKPDNEQIYYICLLYTSADTGPWSIAQFLDFFSIVEYDKNV